MEIKREKHIITASALVIAFAVMIAALMYNPQSSARDAYTIEVHGFVLGEDGTPIENANVHANEGSSQTGADGHYSFSCNYSDEFVSNLDQDDKNIISAVAEGHWTEMQYLDVTDAKSYEVNFTLPKNENMTVPLGVLIYPDTINGSTMVNISVKLSISSIYAIINGDRTSMSIGPMLNPSTRSADDPDYLSFSMQSTNLIPVRLCMNATVTGTFTSSGHINSLAIYQNGPVFASPVGSDRLDYGDVSSNCTTFDLAPGERKDIVAIEPYDGYNGNLFNLPNDPSLSFNFDLMGRNITVQETRICNMNGAEAWHIAHTVTVTIEPLTVGNHSYAAYIEDGCAIHFWELGTS